MSENLQNLVLKNQDKKLDLNEILKNRVKTLEYLDLSGNKLT